MGRDREFDDFLKEVKSNLASVKETVPDDKDIQISTLHTALSDLYDLVTNPQLMYDMLVVIPVLDKALQGIRQSSSEEVRVWVEGLVKNYDKLVNELEKIVNAAKEAGCCGKQEIDEFIINQREELGKSYELSSSLMYKVDELTTALEKAENALDIVSKSKKLKITSCRICGRKTIREYCSKCQTKLIDSAMDAIIDVNEWR